MLDSQLNYAWQWNCHSPDDLLINHLLGDNMTEEQKIQAIKAYAEALYSKGWDVVVEAYDDSQLLEELSRNDMNIFNTILSLQAMIDVRADMMAEHQAEAKSSY